MVAPGRRRGKERRRRMTEAGRQAGARRDGRGYRYGLPAGAAG